ncbi:ammonia-forming cytochrome c nitrite reductase subunit c552 [Alkaliphilus sp. MSJ-5]|uniref:Ammonia-forming cytochrome c nitrite reductase subunit c552 n=1 Tax=Alkaliphilus flagellatus TaxID=2841507 RepID=A0ABS6FXM5_9FIRM|nr:ammonia-forming cytochrome c nitrite reductase subunit c552 [Alkaliphilus flagellatus]
MKQYKRLIVSIIIVLSILITSIGCKPQENKQGQNKEEGKKPEQTVEIPSPDQMILSAEKWKDQFPLIYESLQMTSRFKDGVTEDPELGGSHPISYLEKYPDIKVLYDGIGFGKEYYAARGHYYALHDVINTARPKPGASCLACKTADYEKLLAEYKDDLYAMDFHKVSQEAENGITCYTCHRNEPGKQVQATTPQFRVAVDKLNKEPKPGTMACAQCHVEYYMDPDTKEVILPWDNGLEIANIEAYYDKIDYFDWKHPRTGTPLIKVQHPEFETYSGSVHDKMGVTCADCHMPTVEENGQKYKSHWAKSPLKTLNESCGTCHSSELDGLTAKVQGIQKEIDDELLEIGKMLVQLIENFGTVMEDSQLDDTVVNELWDLHRKAQYRWDFVFVENSTGFHNTPKAKKALSEARNYAQQALDKLAEFQ